MSLRESFITILKVQAVFGLTPFRFDKTSQRMELKSWNLVQSFASYLVISISVVALTILYRYDDDEINLGNTANLSVFSGDTVLVITYNGVMLNWLLRRGDHIKFLNKLNELSVKLKVKLNVGVVDPPIFSKKGLYFQMSIIACFALQIANVIGRDVHTENFHWSICLWNVIFFAEILTQMLAILYIGCLTAALVHYFEAIFIKISKITNVQQNDPQIQLMLPDRTNKELLLCISLFDELIGLKNSFSKLFGHQLLFLFLWEFVNFTMFVYFMLVFLFETSSSLDFIYIFFVFVSPHIVLLLLLVHYMEQLADMVGPKIEVQFNQVNYRHRFFRFVELVQQLVIFAVTQTWKSNHL